MEATKVMDEEDRTVEAAANDDACCGEEGFVRNRASKESRVRFSLVCAFLCAWDGFAYTVRTQRNMKIHLTVAVAAVVLGFALAIDAASWAAIVLCIAAVFAAECFNTALESVVDLVSPGYHELARRAKDCAAAGVLAFALAAVAVALVVFVPRLMALFAV